MAAEPDPSADAAYLEIEAAVMETERGRRFLARHAERARGAQLSAVLEAVRRLEAAVARPIADETAFLAARVAAVIERLRDAAWMMRERGVGETLADLVEREAKGLDELFLGCPMRTEAPPAAISPHRTPPSDADPVARVAGFC
ncbi:MAG: hypothetical protein KGI57_04655 [Hyphomicrobiales bacterium]|nr:hypothetical protein [Hyphomicrobiales bacterium]MDE2016979.1 hypothetical protein [Hyphomicrobiales bacterium]